MVSLFLRLKAGKRLAHNIFDGMHITHFNLMFLIRITHNICFTVTYLQMSAVSSLNLQKTEDLKQIMGYKSIVYV